jgi:hypothetical protein
MGLSLDRNVNELSHTVLHQLHLLGCSHFLLTISLERSYSVRFADWSLQLGVQCLSAVEGSLVPTVDSVAH